MRNVLRRCLSLLPGPGVRWLRQRFGWRWFRGDYPDWAAARAASAGYDHAAVLARVLAATREVHAGRAHWERDGMAFSEPMGETPLLAALRQAVPASGRLLRVVDFGGALGSTWWQHRMALRAFARVKWRVVEQPHYVAAGGEFADDQLSFHLSLADALAADVPDVILLSSVLPYIESPLALLRDIAAQRPAHVIIDRTPLVCAGPTRLAVQHTPLELGGGSYPCWLFERSGLLAPLDGAYEVAAEWPGFDDLAPDIKHRGFHFRLRRP